MSEGPAEPLGTRVREALEEETRRCQRYYTWLEQNMPTAFFEEVSEDNVILIVHNLMVLHLQDYFSLLHLKNLAFAMTLDSPDADSRVLSHYRNMGIKHYRTYLSKSPLPLEGQHKRVLICAIYATEAIETIEQPISAETIAHLKRLIQQRNPSLTDEEYLKLISGINTRFLGTLAIDRLVLALDMFFRARTRDACQYEVRYNDRWKELGEPSMQIVLAWRGMPKYGFLYRLAQLVFRHGLVMKRVNATYIEPYGTRTMLLAVDLHGTTGEAAWDAADIPDFLRELVTLKYFACLPEIERVFVNTGMVTGNLGNLLKSMVYFIHQILVHVDPFLYTLDNVVEGLCRHPELSIKLCEAFERKFHPERHDLAESEQLCAGLQDLVERLDTGHQVNDVRRRNVIKQGINFVRHALKTNFYRNNKSAVSFRLNPDYLDYVPPEAQKRFPEKPFAVFFMKGFHYISFHIRFRDLSRGGLRTVVPERREDMLVELNNVFYECYSLAYTQQKKNKDIPEGGAKGVIFLEPYESLVPESNILIRELKLSNFKAEEIDARVASFVRQQREEYLYQAQRSYVDSLLTLVNCEPDGTLKAKNVVDYYRKPEYIYLGPDENMHTPMLTWIAEFSRQQGYKPGLSFISSKPGTGINHKEYGVTSLGVNVYMEEVLRFIGIEPKEQSFTVKMSGGPDGDVAGNQMLNLYRDFRKSAKLVAVTDVSGTIRDLSGLDLEEVHKLFRAAQPIAAYPPEKLSEGSFLLDRRKKRDLTPYVQQTLCWRKKNGELLQDWLAGSETARLFHLNVHETNADIFIPAGGRPRSLNEHNVHEFLGVDGAPTSKAIIEGANLYLTQAARRTLEQKGVLIVKDSSANKCGVICSSFEVLLGLVLTEDELLKHRDLSIKQILDTLRARALDEARLLLSTHKQTNSYLTDISEMISNRINAYTDQLLAYLNPLVLPHKQNDPLVRCLLSYCLPVLREHYADRVLAELPEGHKKAIIASYLAARLVYDRGLDWHPTIVDILPTVLHQIK